MDDKRKIRIIILISVYFLLGIGFALVFTRDYSPIERVVMEYATKEGRETDIFRLEEDSPFAEATISHSGISLTISRNDVWTQGRDSDNSDEHFGGTYAFVFKNRNTFTISNWELTLVCGPMTAVSDNAFWDCMVTVGSANDDDSRTTLVISSRPDINPKIIPESEVAIGNDRASFGMVIHSPDELPVIRSVKLAALTTRSVTDNPLFWILAVLSAAVLVATLLFIGFSIREHKYLLQKQYDENIIIQSINTIVNFVDAKDPYTKGHSSRVADYSLLIAKKMGLDRESCKNLYYIAMMHDVGKVGIPDSILQKPGRLTPEERKVIESHTTVGGQMLRDFNAITGIVSGALYHHERYDGTGYPHGLLGEDIPFYARVICVADAFDAMSSERCYRSKLNYDEIVRELSLNSGKQFDPVIAGIMLELLSEAAAQGRLSEFNL